MRRSCLLLILTALAALASPTPASADPAQPTDFRSRIVAVEPALPAGVRVSVVGGDAFLELRVARGHTVEVPDYAQGRDQPARPYLRFRADGVVERDETSLAALVNDDRFGTDAGRSVETGTGPRWRVVARNGRHAWHDHRIHWMLRRPPTVVDDRGRVDLGSDGGTWEVPLVVDGGAVTVRGELLLLEGPSPAPWLALAAVVGLGMVALAVAPLRRGRAVPHAVLSAALAVVGVAAAVVAAVAWRAVPPGTGPRPTSTLLAASGVVLAGTTVVARRARRPRVARAGMAGAVAALGSWALLRRDVLTHAWLPTELPFVVDRAVTAVALGAAAGAAVVLVWHPPAPDPDHDDLHDVGRPT